MKKILSITLILLAFVPLVRAQCPAPTGAIVSTTSITCAGSGVISVSAVSDSSGTIALADCKYSLYDASNAVIIKPIQADSVLRGLDSGTYTLRIAKACTLTSGVSADYTQTVHIDGYYTGITMNTPDVIPASCSNGAITAHATGGYGAYSFCLVDSINAPVAPAHYVRPLQSSQTFSSLAAGTYFVRVYDACSNTGMRTRKVEVPAIPDSTPFSGTILALNHCDGYDLTLNLAYALTLDSSRTMTATFPDGYVMELSGINTDQLHVPVTAARLASSTYPFHIQIRYSDGCGKTHDTTFVINEPHYLTSFSDEAASYTCGMGMILINKHYVVDNNNTVNSNTDIWDFYSLDSGKTWLPYTHPMNDTVFVAAGTSQQVIYQHCGLYDTVNVFMPSIKALNVHLFESGAMACKGNSGIGFDVWTFNGSADSILVHMVSAPPGQTLSPDFYIANYGKPRQMMNLAPGTYAFDFTDQCGITQSGISITITPSIQQFTVRPVFSCGSSVVNLELHHSSNKDGDLNMGYIVKNNSGTIVAGPDFAYVSTGPSGVDKVVSNLPPGRYTVTFWKVDVRQTTYSTDSVCIDSFTVDATLPGPLKINKSIFAICTNDSTAGAVVAMPQGGLPPYTYTLYKDSVSAANQVGAPQGSPIFDNLDVNAKYIIYVTDQCGSGDGFPDVFANVKPRVYTANDMMPCTNDSITLLVSKNSALTYQWTMNGSPIAGATDTFYHIASVQRSDSGRYGVHISANSCLLLTTQILIDPAKCGMPIALPLDLLKFNGSVDEQNHVVLNWEVAAPQETDLYTVLYSTDGSRFYTAGTLNGSKLTLYRFTHNAVTLSSRLYYKLALTNNAGNTTYSPVISLQGTMGSMSQLTASPVPFVNQLNVIYTATAASTIALQLTDVNGRTLKQQQVAVQAGANSISLSGLEAVPAGIYFLKTLEATGKMQTLKVVK